MTTEHQATPTFATDRRTGERFRHAVWGTVRVHPCTQWSVELDSYGEAIELDEKGARDLAASLLAALDLPTSTPSSGDDTTDEGEAR